MASRATLETGEAGDDEGEEDGKGDDEEEYENNGKKRVLSFYQQPYTYGQQPYTYLCHRQVSHYAEYLHLMTLSLC